MQLNLAFGTWLLVVITNYPHPGCKDNGRTKTGSTILITLQESHIIHNRNFFMFLYNAVSSPRTAQSVLHFTPWQTCSFRHSLYFSGKHSTMLQLLPEDYWLAFHTISIARYSFIQLSELGRHAENESAQASGKNSEGHSNPGSLDCEFDILPLSYFAPHKVTLYTIEASSLMSQKLKKFKKSQKNLDRAHPTHHWQTFLETHHWHGQILKS